MSAEAMIEPYKKGSTGVSVVCRQMRSQFFYDA